MTVRKQLPFMIELLDDDSEEVQKAIIKEFLKYGPHLKSDLLSLDEKILKPRINRLDFVFRDCQKVWLKEQWLKCFSQQDDTARLEEFLCQLSNYLTGLRYKDTLGSLLDALTEGFSTRHRDGDSVDLANYLFQEKRLKGNERDYYNPQNSNLIYTLKEKRGLPISLVCIYILVGRRVGLEIEGFNFPGHFMARIEDNGSRILVDCFHGGNFIKEEDWARFNSITKMSMRGADSHVTTEKIIQRVLVNLIHAYQMIDDEENKQFIMELYNDMDQEEKTRAFLNNAPDAVLTSSQMEFQPGQMISHQLYGYRGLIVAYDQTCQADDSWYFSNRTQPDRDQPWYHILVHESKGVTYAAQSNLVADKKGGDIDHPLIEYFFEKTLDGRYVRNDVPWPKN